MLENAGDVKYVVCANDFSNLGNTVSGDSSCGGVRLLGVEGGVGIMAVDTIEAFRCLEERDCGCSKFAVDVESTVDTESRLSNVSMFSPSTSDAGFTCVTWKRACGGSEPKT